MDEDEKTEEPTGKRLDEAREQGQVARSMDLAQAATLLVGTLALSMSGAALVGGLRECMIACFRAIPTWRADEATVSAWLLPSFLFLARLLWPILLPILLAGLLVNILMVGFHVSLSSLEPKFGKLFSLAALGRMFSRKAAVDLLKNLLKMAVVGWIGFGVVSENAASFLEMSQWTLLAQTLFTVAVAKDALLKMALVLLVLGVADWFWQKFEFHKQMKMSKQEVKDEARQSEGDPQVKGKIRRMRMEMHRRFMMQEVPKATVVVTNPTHFSVALRYEQGKDAAPVVVAKGQDHMAFRIREIARENDVPVVENPPLARALYREAEPGDPVPVALYTAVAEVLAFVYRLRQGAPAPGPAIRPAGAPLAGASR